MGGFLNLREIDDGTEFETDICVIGAGAAGITLAKELAGSAHEVLLVESGGLDIDADTNGLAEGENVGMTYVPLESARVRTFGGTTAHWTGWCTPLRPIDLRQRPWVPHSGWPLTFETLAPYYVRAGAICEVGTDGFGEKDWSQGGDPPDPLDPATFGFAHWRKGPPTRFGERYRQDLAAAANVRVLLFANAVSLGADPGARRVEQVELKATTGRRARVRARRVVLACGTIENARLLLASDAVAPNGLGNDRDLVGRFFMEHPDWKLADVYTDDAAALVGRYYTRTVDGYDSRIAAVLADAAQERLGVQDCAIGYDFQFDTATAPPYRRMMRSLSQGEWPADIGAGVWSLLQNLGDAARSTWQRTVEGRRSTRSPRQVRIGISLDPQPNPDSRVTLSDQRDLTGMRQPRLDWQVTRDDARSMTVITKLFAAEITRLGLGRVQLHPALADASGDWALAGNLAGFGVNEEAPELMIAWHHAGTTRMADDPARGVVDADCRVHGLENLYVVGGSVFPTAGYANPTLTIVALAARLADHLRA